jgi:hypothetical protein
MLQLLPLSQAKFCATVVEECSVPLIGTFTAFADKRVRCSSSFICTLTRKLYRLHNLVRCCRAQFCDRTLLELDASRTACSFVLQSGSTADVRLDLPSLPPPQTFHK